MVHQPPDLPITDEVLPRLRSVDICPVSQNGQPVLLLRDPLRLSEKQALIPQGLLPVIMLLDGNHDYHSLAQTLTTQHGIKVTANVIRNIITGLDDALLLENGHFVQELAVALDKYRRAPCRPATNAGSAYPHDKQMLARHLDQYIHQANSPTIANPCALGLVSPHIDYERGGSVYGSVWAQAAQAAFDADLVVIIGTDHNGASPHVTLTRQHYSTPYGILPTAVDLVDKLSATIGDDLVMQDELHHRDEHSVELAAVWLHHVRHGKPVPTLPVLVGSFSHFIANETSPRDERNISKFVETVQSETNKARVLFIAAGDMSHVGPAFNGPPLSSPDKIQLEASDAKIIDAMCTGDPDAFFDSVNNIQDMSNICGLAPIYLLLRILEPVRGTALAYQQCPADQDHASVVSICGVVFE